MTVTEHEHELTEQRRDQLVQYYNDVCQWPTKIDPTTGEVRLLLGEVVDALYMRAGFAGEVNNFLARHMLRAPIITVPGDSADWIFLTGPRTTMRLPVWEDLVRIQVSWKRRGETIVLPALDNTDNGARWLEWPQQHTKLPPWTAVVAAARSASSLWGRP
ncbi:hypothetical protein [Amycolatopsis taiwanensis]|uniref:Uncharacterized protein n=1 Tax=Amycolatopsis taiwanensis TaxID=342230 RepID=A0A9W6R520_9PSEU|nr:hypothetical protein [Amycolatopsis taiwanensis]GLY69589.1 hypothetical protein Atai01_62080 [Amycolatopsis taiwanensis]